MTDLVGKDMITSHTHRHTV